MGDIGLWFPKRKALKTALVEIFEIQKYSQNLLQATKICLNIYLLFFYITQSTNWNENWNEYTKEKNLIGKK